MMKKYQMILGLLVLGLSCTVGFCAAQTQIPADAGFTVTVDEIEPYNGPVGPDNVLYGLKIAFEDLDETFTFNQTERLEKQLKHARLRISEVRRELERNSIYSADRALELYWQKLNATEGIIVLYAPNTTGLLHAQEMITKHQQVLSDLLLSHPNNTGLQRAYNNSLALEDKFEQKTQIKFERIMEKNNQTILKAVRLEIKEQERGGKGEGEHIVTQEQTRTEDKTKTKGQKGVTTVTTAVTVQTSETEPTHTPTIPSDQDRSRGQDKKNGDTSTDDKGRDNSRNK